MKKCAIKTIESHPLRGMDFLVELNWSHNSITALDDSTFAGAKALDTLLLYDNQISSIAIGTFSLPNLKKLDLSENKLHQISPRLFASASALKFLSLASNPMQQQEKLVLPWGILEFRFVPFGAIDITWYESLPSLRILKLGQCATNVVIWPERSMPSIHTLELTPKSGFADGNVFLADLEKFPNLHDAKFTINTFKFGVRVNNVRGIVPNIHKLIINDVAVTRLDALFKDPSLKAFNNVRGIR